VRAHGGGKASGVHSLVVERSIDIGALTLAVKEAGVGGRPLLLVHGFTGNNTDFDPVIEPLAERGWHVVAPDNRGHGRSEKPDVEEAYSLESFTSDTLDLANALGWDEFVLLGHSMGGMIAQVLTLAAPRRVRALILMDTSHTHVDIDPELVQLGIKLAREEGLATIVEVLRGMDDPLATPAHLRMCATVPGYRERGENNTLACSAAMYAAMLFQLTEPHDRLPQLASVTCPTLILVGEQDGGFVEASGRMAAVIPDARLDVIPDAGHSPQFEATDAWLATVLPFLDEVAAG
jgi:pimeloyl-ACP methyl ester carboxylesterase